VGTLLRGGEWRSIEPQMGLHECQWKSAFPPSNWILVNRDDGYTRPKQKRKKKNSEAN